ncbi:MAG TPA: STAS domain-containing protein [Steroidobacteraceae bacterium]
MNRGSDSAASFRLVASGNGRFAAEGALTFATAREASEQGLRSLASAAAPELEVDCSGIVASDSAGLAVLLDWLGAVKRAGRRLRYTQLPAGLKALGRISEIEELLERGV